jgi:hypothetical protein
MAQFEHAHPQERTVERGQAFDRPAFEQRHDHGVADSSLRSSVPSTRSRTKARPRRVDRRPRPRRASCAGSWRPTSTLYSVCRASSRAKRRFTNPRPPARRGRQIVAEPRRPRGKASVRARWPGTNSTVVLTPLDARLAQGALHPRHRLFARAPRDHDLGQQRVVVRRDLQAGIDLRIDAHAEAAGQGDVGQGARGRREVGVFGIDPALDRMAARDQVVLGERELQPAAMRICSRTRSTP